MQSKTSPIRLGRLEKVHACWALRLRGKRIKDIAAEVGCSVGATCEYVQEAYKEYRQEYAQEASETARIDLARLDAVIDALWTNAMTGDVKACLAVLKALESRARITGHNAVEKIEVVESANVAELKEKLQDLMKDK